ncbi:MAG TPA: hypothetical protein VHI98_06435 [Vicinamibacterales bacterium]|jgi:hypothetical protein|nr:hypothetical protein [Vicinamibacterales bacterium]
MTKAAIAALLAALSILLGNIPSTQQEIERIEAIVKATPWDRSGQVERRPPDRSATRATVGPLGPLDRRGFSGTVQRAQHDGGECQARGVTVQTARPSSNSLLKTDVDPSRVHSQAALCFKR